MNIGGQRSNVGTDLRFWCGAPGRIRTRDPLLRRQLLCPAELRALERNCARGRSRDGYMMVAVCRPLTPCHLGKRHAASPPRTPQPPRLPHPAVSRRVPLGRSRITGASAAQLASSELRPAAVTSESRPFRIHTLSRQAVRGPVQSLKVARGFMPLSLVSSPRDSSSAHAYGRGCRVRAAGAHCRLASGPGPGGSFPKIGLRSRRHH